MKTLVERWSLQQSSSGYFEDIVVDYLHYSDDSRNQLCIDLFYPSAEDLLKAGGSSVNHRVNNSLSYLSAGHNLELHLELSN